MKKYETFLLSAGGSSDKLALALSGGISGYGFSLRVPSGAA